MSAPVLVVGAGPVGLFLAVSLRLQGTPVRIVDRRSKLPSSTESRAVLLHPRTMEALHRLGLLPALLPHVLPATSARVIDHNFKVLADLEYHHLSSDTLFPCLFSVSQGVLERILYDQLLSFDSFVEWDTEVVDLHPDASGVEVVFADGHRSRHDYVVGCDGAHSTIARWMRPSTPDASGAGATVDPFARDPGMEVLTADVILQSSLLPERCITTVLQSNLVAMFIPMPPYSMEGGDFDDTVEGPPPGTPSRGRSGSVQGGRSDDSGLGVVSPSPPLGTSPTTGRGMMPGGRRLTEGPLAADGSARRRYRINLHLLQATSSLPPAAVASAAFNVAASALSSASSTMVTRASQAIPNVLQSGYNAFRDAPPPYQRQETVVRSPAGAAMADASTNGQADYFMQVPSLQINGASAGAWAAQPDWLGATQPLANPVNAGAGPSASQYSARTSSSSAIAIATADASYSEAAMAEAAGRKVNLLVSSDSLLSSRSSLTSRSSLGLQTPATLGGQITTRSASVDGWQLVDATSAPATSAPEFPHGSAVNGTHAHLVPANPPPGDRMDVDLASAGVDSEDRHALDSRTFLACFAPLGMTGYFQLGDIVWLSRYRSRSYLASRYSVGRVFVAGDAAHTEALWGGHCMNAGLADAENLAWKLDLAVKGAAPTSLLDTYSEERREVARQMRQTADLIRQVVVARSPAVQTLRNYAFAGVAGFPCLRDRVTDALSFVNYGYDGLSLAREGAPAGTRIPPIPLLAMPNRIECSVHDLLYRRPELVVFVYCGQTKTAADKEWMGLEDAAASIRSRFPQEMVSICWIVGDEASVELASSMTDGIVFLDSAGRFAQLMGGRPGRLILRPDGYLLAVLPWESQQDCIRLNQCLR